jgi:hypothetical protein
VLTLVVGVVAMMALDYGIHHILLQADYEMTKHLWRTEAEMMELCHFMIFANVVFVFTIVFLYGAIGKVGGLGQAVKIGGVVGLLSGAGMFSSYAYSPIHYSLALKWLLAGIVYGIVVGIITGVLYKDGCCAKGKCCPKEGEESKEEEKSEA